jgi:hypothetical protein
MAVVAATCHALLQGRFHRDQIRRAKSSSASETSTSTTDTKKQPQQQQDEQQQQEPKPNQGFEEPRIPDAAPKEVEVEKKPEGVAFAKKGFLNASTDAPKKTEQQPAKKPETTTTNSKPSEEPKKVKNIDDVFEECWDDFATAEHNLEDAMADALYDNAKKQAKVLSQEAKKEKEEKEKKQKEEKKANLALD